MDVANASESFWDEHGTAIVTACVAMAIAFAVAFAVDRAFQRRGRQLAEAVLRGEVSRETDTRLRFVRRVVYAVILLAGVATAMSQFAGLNRIAASFLASGVVAAAIVGFAARQTLANFVAGVMLAITQPIRVGDWVTVADHHGQVEDVRLNYTILRTGGEQRIVVPNEMLANSVLANDTLSVDVVAVEVSVWVPPGADVGRALAALREECAEASVAEATPDGVRIVVAGDRVAPHEKSGREAELRERCLGRLHAAGLMEGFAASDRS